MARHKKNIRRIPQNIRGMKYWLNIHSMLRVHKSKSSSGGILGDSQTFSRALTLCPGVPRARRCVPGARAARLISARLCAPTPVSASNKGSRSATPPLCPETENVTWPCASQLVIPRHDVYVDDSIVLFWNKLVIYNWLQKRKSSSIRLFFLFVI